MTKDGRTNFYKETSKKIILRYLRIVKSCPQQALLEFVPRVSECAAKMALTRILQELEEEELIERERNPECAREKIVYYPKI